MFYLGYQTDYYSAMRKKEVLPFVTVWVSPENIMLSEMRQTQKDKYHMISVICGIKKKKAKLMVTRVEERVIRGWGVGKKGK